MTESKKDFFDLSTVQDICKRYAKFGTSMSELGKEFNVTRDKIRTVFAKAIIFGYVSTELALEMKEVAIKHSIEACTRNGITSNANKIEKYYDNLISSSIKRKRASERIDYIRFLLEVYDDNYSSDEDFPYSKESLLEELNNCKEIIKKADELV